RLHRRPLPQELGRRELPPRRRQRHPLERRRRGAEGRRQGRSRPGGAEEEPRSQAVIPGRAATVRERRTNHRDTEDTETRHTEKTANRQKTRSTRSGPLPSVLAGLPLCVPYLCVLCVSVVRSPCLPLLHRHASLSLSPWEGPSCRRWPLA